MRGVPPSPYGPLVFVSQCQGTGVQELKKVASLRLSALAVKTRDSYSFSSVRGLNTTPLRKSIETLPPWQTVAEAGAVVIWYEIPFSAQVIPREGGNPVRRLCSSDGLRSGFPPSRE